MTPTPEQLERAREIVQRFSDARLPGEYWYRLTQAIAQALRDARAETLEEACTEINSFQDIVGWQPGESRNALVVEIWNAVRALAQDQGGDGER